MLDQDVARCPIEIGQLLAGKYRVDRILGVGAMGVVVVWLSRTRLLRA